MVLHDVRPPAIDANFRPGNTFSAILNWPAASLTGRTFTATLDAISLTVSHNGTVMTVSATAAQTTTAGRGRHSFELTETTGGLTDDIIIGTWLGSTADNASASTETTVTVGGNTVTVTVLGVGASLASLTVTGAISTASLSASGAVSASSLSSTTLTVTGASTFRGVPLAQYERMTFVGDQMRPDSSAPATAGNTNAYTGWDFADGSTQAVVWPFAPPRIGVDPIAGTHLFWSTFAVALVWINLGAGSGNVRWQVEFFNYAIAIDAITEAAATTSVSNVPALGQNIQSAVVIAESITLSPAFFGSEYKMRVARIGADAGDTLTNAVRLGCVSLNRVT